MLSISLRGSGGQLGLLLGSFMMFGAMFGVWQVSIADLSNSLDISEGPLGLAITLGALVSVPFMMSGGRIIARWGEKRIVITGAAVMAAVYIGLAGITAYWMLLGVLICMACASGVYDVAINSSAMEFEQRSQRQVFSLLHAGFSGSAAAGLIVAGLLLTIGVPYRLLYIGVTAGYLMLIVLLMRRRQFPERVARPAGTGSTRSLELFLFPPLLIIALVTSAGFFLEGSMETWIVLYLRESIELPVFVAAVSGALFHLAMMTGRLLSARIVAGVGRKRTLQLSGAVACAGLLIALATEQPVVILIGFFVVGIALASVAPVTFSLAGDTVPGRSGDASSVVATIGYSGFLFGPGTLGTIAEASSLRVALLCAAVLGVAMVTLASRIREPGRVQQETATGAR